MVVLLLHPSFGLLPPFRSLCVHEDIKVNSRLDLSEERCKPKLLHGGPPTFHDAMPPLCVLSSASRSRFLTMVDPLLALPTSSESALDFIDGTSSGARLRFLAMIDPPLALPTTSGDALLLACAEGLLGLLPVASWPPSTSRSSLASRLRSASLRSSMSPSE